jgi:glucose-fructose oxidoreductase
MAEDDTGEPTLSRREFLGSGSQAAAFTLLSTETSFPSSQPPEDRVGVAVVGLGNFAQYVLPRLRGARRVRVAALVSGSPDTARRLAGGHGVPENRIYSYESFDRLAEARDVHAVYIALPVGLHAEYAMRALRLGKHVLTEKTMAASVEQGRAMVAAARSAGRVLMVAYRARFDTYNQAAMRMARQRELGEVVAITAHKGFALGSAVGQRGWRTQRSLAGGGTLVDIGIYSVQAARYLAGEEPVEVTAISRSTIGDPRFREVEEDMTWSLRFPGGALASCSASWRYALQNRYRVACTEGWFELEPATSNGNLRLRVGRGNRGEVVEERMLPQVDQIPLMFDHFAECVREGKAPLTPGEEGLRDLEVIAAIYEAAASGRAVRLASG